MEIFFSRESRSNNCKYKYCSKKIAQDLCAIKKCSISKQIDGNPIIGRHQKNESNKPKTLRIKFHKSSNLSDHIFWSTFLWRYRSRGFWVKNAIFWYLSVLRKVRMGVVLVTGFCTCKNFDHNFWLILNFLYFTPLFV